ncbi:tetratricopeptide repeat protein, partial [Limnospira platensis]|uniref:tetratricopeptide repeat protein n=1 Tax=Limnospira platensis TaxID=118562 RepID=UPI003D6E81BF
MSDLLRGNQLLRNGKLEESVAAFQGAIAHNPNFHWSHYKLGEALEKLGHLDAAQAAYRQAMRLKNSGSSPIGITGIKNKQSSYWDQRKDYIYIFAVKQIINQIGSGASSIIDIGSAGCPYIDWFSWIPERYSLDLRNPYK